jgi:hypothetical protein
VCTVELVLVLFFIAIILVGVELPTHMQLVELS